MLEYFIYEDAFRKGKTSLEVMKTVIKRYVVFNFLYGSECMNNLFIDE